MNEVVKFIAKHSDTDTNINTNGQMVIEAYDQEGDIIDTYFNPESEIAEYFENKYRKESDLSGSELIAEEFEGSYYKAFEAIKEDLAS